uniref:Uncharacterized protein n=1 Tax=Ascaris lumbricoides TaxID=6252 RepID=A0A0M3HLI6_ASCLU
MTKLRSSVLRSVGLPGEATSPNIESPDDEILDGLVKAATVQSEPRDHRRRARQFNRKSCKQFHSLRLMCLHDSLIWKIQFKEKGNGYLTSSVAQKYASCLR